MTAEQMLAGSLSNDLFRVATLAQRGSAQAAMRFLKEAQRWSNDLQELPTKEYIKKIAQDISATKEDDISTADSEKYLMYGVLLQNFCLHYK
ncbi:MAG: hypothetical protein M3Q81_00340 [bacterium]|nr:hypothetical protein [bacterium]